MFCFRKNRAIYIASFGFRPREQPAESAKKDGQDVWLLSVWRIGGYLFTSSRMCYVLGKFVIALVPLLSNVSTVAGPCVLFLRDAAFYLPDRRASPSAFLTSCIQPPPL